MEGRRSHGRGASRGRGVRQSQEPRNKREIVAEQDRRPRIEAGDQVATAIQQMTTILAGLGEQQSQTPVNQPRNSEIGEKRSLARFQKFFIIKFFGGADPEVAENWLAARVKFPGA